MTTNDNVAASAFPIVIVGHVDHGKSTLIGRLLNDTGSLPEGKLSELRRVSKHRGTEMEWSFALDALQIERDQAITIDSTQIWFQSALRRYVIIDAPGHREFLRNMITGAAQAEAAVIVVDATHGLTEQTKRHAYLLHLLGVSQVIVAINKLDKVGFDQSLFERLSLEARNHLESLSLKMDSAIPVSARDGDNLAIASERISWWSGPTLIEALDALKRQRTASAKPFRLAVQDVYRDGDARTIVGRVESGRLKIGDLITFWPSRRNARVKAFESWNAATPILSVAAPQSVAFTVDDDLFVERGNIAAGSEGGPRQSCAVRARLFWLAGGKLNVGKSLRMRVGTSLISVTVSHIHRVLDVECLEFQDKQIIETNDIAEVTLTSSAPFIFDLFHEHDTLGRAVLIDGYEVVAGCVIDQDAAGASHVNQGVAKSEHFLSKRHEGAVFWLTGLSGAGKSTLAEGLRKDLLIRGAQVFVLDGDIIRKGLNSDLGYSQADRTENLRRVAQVAKFLAGEGALVIAAFITPTTADRRLVREIIGAPFYEVFVKADLDICEARDVKGLYAKARAGQLEDFTGISSLWETPASPDLTLHTAFDSYDSSLLQLLTYVTAVAFTGDDSTSVRATA